MDARMDLLIGDLSKTLQWTSPPPTQSRDKVSLLTHLSSSLLTEYTQLLADKSQVVRERDNLKRQMTLMQSQTHQISSEIEKKLKFWRFHTVMCDECKAAALASEDVEQALESDKGLSIDTIAEVDDENDPELLLEDEQLESGLEGVVVPRDVVRIQKRLFANIGELYRLVLNGDKDLSLGQQIREISLENQTLRVHNLDLTHELESLQSSYSCNSRRSASPVKCSPRMQSFRNRQKQTWAKTKLPESKCLCGLLQAIVTTLYNMIREKDQIEVALDQFTPGTETTEIPFDSVLGLAETMETSVKSNSEIDRIRLKRSDFAPVKEKKSSDSAEALIDKLKKKSRKITKLKERLNNLRKAVGNTCKRIEKVQQMRSTSIQESCWVLDTPSETLFRTPKTDFSQTQRLFERLVELTVEKNEDWDDERALCCVKRAAKEVKKTLKAAQRHWMDYFPADFKSEEEKKESLFSDIGMFLQKIIDIFPLFDMLFDSARRCQFLLQKVNRTSPAKLENVREKLNFRSFSQLLADIEHNLLQITSEKSSFHTPPSKNRRTRSRFSFSSNEKLFKDEVESIEKAKNEVQLQELQFENEQLKDLQCIDRMKITDFSRQVSALASENKTFREKISNLEDAIEHLQEKLINIKTLEESSLRITAKVDYSPTEVHSKLDELDQSIKELLKTMQNEKRETLLPRLRKIVTKNLEFGLGIYFSRWKTATFSMSFSGSWGDDPLRLWKLSLIRKNQLFDCVNADDSSIRTPMPPVIVIKTIDEIMLKCADSFSPESFPTFAIEYMTNKLGCRNSAIRTLKQAVATLLSFTDEEFYGQFLARIMQIQNPMSDGVIEFFVRVNCQIYGLVRKRSEEKMDERDRLGIDMEFIDPESGGKLFLSDALDLLYSLEISKDADLCRKVVNFLRASDMDKRDYVLFVVSHKVLREDYDPSNLFDGSPNMPLPAFIPRLKSRLSLCLSEKKLLNAFQPFQTKGRIALADVKKAVSLQFYGLNATNDHYTVDRFYFLYVLSFVYDYRVDRSIEFLRSLYEASSLEEDKETCFWMSLFNVDPNLGEVRCRAMVTEAIAFFNTEDLDETHFINFVAEKQLGTHFLQPFRVARSEAAHSMRRRERNEILSQSSMQTILSPDRRVKRKTIVGVNLRSPRRSDK